MYIVNDQPVYCFKKALFLIHIISARFGSKTPAPFPIPRTDTLPVFTDNVIPSMLIHLGVLDLSNASSGLDKFFTDAQGKVDALLVASASPSTGKPVVTRETPKDGPHLRAAQAYILRAAAIDACEMIVQKSRSLVDGNFKEMTTPQLDMWLWGVAKDREDYRVLERFVERNTVFF